MVAKVPPGGQDGPRIARRDAILDAALALFAERGFAGVSVQEIADTAETHKTTVLYHFASKESLYEAVLSEALGRIAQVMREFMGGEFGRERVAYMLDQQQAFFREHPAYARLLERELLDSANPQVYIKQFVEPIYLPALQSLERAMTAGRVRRIDPALFIHDLHVQLLGYFCHRPLIERLKEGDPYSVQALIERRDYLVDQIFRMLAPDFRERTLR